MFKKSERTSSGDIGEHRVRDKTFSGLIPTSSKATVQPIESPNIWQGGSPSLSCQ